MYVHENQGSSITFLYYVNENQMEYMHVYMGELFSVIQSYDVSTCKHHIVLYADIKIVKIMYCYKLNQDQFMDIQLIYYLMWNVFHIRIRL